MLKDIGRFPWFLYLCPGLSVRLSSTQGIYSTLLSRKVTAVLCCEQSGKLGKITCGAALSTLLSNLECNQEPSSLAEKREIQGRVH